MTFDESSSLQCYVLNPSNRWMVVSTQLGSTARIGIWSFPEKKQIQSIVCDSTHNQIQLMAVSRSGQRLVTISSRLPRKLIYWDRTTGKPIAEEPLAVNERYTSVSFNPRNDKEFITVKADGIRMWKYEPLRFDQSPFLKCDANVVASDTTRKPKLKSRDALARDMTDKFLHSNFGTNPAIALGMSLCILCV